MKIGRRTVIVLVPLWLAGCVAQDATTSSAGIAAPDSRDYDVVDLTVTVPRTLTVSEANVYYPSADIVWRGEPQGDRYAQIQRIFEDGFGRGVRSLDGARDVTVDVEVRRFHSVTERARYSVGGVHSIRFVLTVRNARTAEVVEGPRLVAADLAALGGERALRADRAGQTQRVRLVDHLARVAVAELGDPVGS